MQVKNNVTKLELVRKRLNEMCLSGDLGGKTLELSEYLDVLVVKEQCRLMGIKGIRSLGGNSQNA